MHNGWFTEQNVKSKTSKRVELYKKNTHTQTKEKTTALKI